MIRNFPENLTSNDLSVKWPKSILLTTLTGIFAIFLLSAIIVLIKNPYESSNIFLNYNFMLIVLTIAELYCVKAFMWHSKNYINPYKRLVANNEGLFLDITLKENSAFFIPWQNILTIERKFIEIGDKDDENFFSGYVFYVKLKSNSEYSFPKIMRGIEACSEKEINMAENTLDMDLDSVIDKLNAMKNNNC